MAKSIHLAAYLFARLKQMGVESVYGVPGDYQLQLLDYVEPAGLVWVGNANELNAGYAADGYARIKGIAALVTTFGVGELSAINAIAGAYTERAAVVHIVGTPERASQESHRLIHHTFNDGEYRRFAQIHAQVTVAQTNLTDPRTGPDEIDRVLHQCVLQQRPVYIEVPVDLVSAPVSSLNLDRAIRPADNVPTRAQEAAITEVLDRMYSAKQPLILVDGESRALGIVDDLEKLIQSTGWPTWLSTYGKGLVDETVPNVHGVYEGGFGDTRVQDFFARSDLVLCFGPHFSSTNSYLYTSIPDARTMISFGDNKIAMGAHVVRDLPARYALSQLVQRLDVSRIMTYQPYPDLPRNSLLSFSTVKGEDKIEQGQLWPLLANLLQPGDILLAETGTAGYGCRAMPLPAHTRLFAPVTWLSIGYMLPAAVGAAFAQKELIASSQYFGIGKAQIILVIGDGSFQMTVQEIGTMIRHNLNVVLIVLNNNGYTIERCLHGLRQSYNDIPPWRYLHAPSFFGAKSDTYTATVNTWSDLQHVVDSPAVRDGTGFRMVEIHLDQEDTPAGILSQLMRQQQQSYAEPHART